MEMEISWMTYSVSQTLCSLQNVIHCYGPDYCDKLIYLTFKSQTTADVSQDPEHKYLESGEKQHVSTLWVCPEI